MSDFVSMIILAIVQGLTEWLPISSSGHLVLVSRLLGYENSIMFDVALHFGTLMAVFVYYGRDISDILEAILKGRWKSKEGRMAFLLIVSAVPAAIIGYTFKAVFEKAFESLVVVAMGFAITGVVLFIGSMSHGKEKIYRFRDAFLIGCAQALAIFPGISRSGSTISSGLLLGLDEKESLKFSFLMAIPVIFGANIVEIGNNKLPASMLIPTLVSFIVGLATIWLLLKIVVSSRKNLRWFGIYALLLALGIGVYLMFF